MLLVKVVGSKVREETLLPKDDLCTMCLPFSARRINGKSTSLPRHIFLATDSHEYNDGKDASGNLGVRAFKTEPNFPVARKSRSNVLEHYRATNHRSWAWPVGGKRGAGPVRGRLSGSAIIPMRRRRNTWRLDPACSLLRSTIPLAEDRDRRLAQLQPRCLHPSYQVLVVGEDRCHYTGQSLREPRSMCGEPHLSYSQNSLQNHEHNKISVGTTTFYAPT